MRHDTRPSLYVGRWQFFYSTSSLGIPGKFFSYSFRSGAATAAAAAGLPVPLIHARERWVSDA
jgi:hypothetical protein